MKELNKVLANIAVLNQKVYNLHWNVRGAEFLSTHKMTEELYEMLTKLFDEVAEKVAMGSETPLSNFKGYLEVSDIKEEEARVFSTNEVSDIIVKDLNILEKSVNEVKASNTVQPLLDEIYLLIDKQRWLFKSIKS